jgi:beta-lactamase regulating signal transducer with metallopeptidase domain
VDWQQIGIGLWTLGLMFVFGRVLIGCRKVLKLKSAAQIPLPVLVTEAVLELKSRLGVRSFPDVRVSADVGTPLAIGIGRPTILLPQEIAESATQADLFAILAHEFAHLDQKHFVSAFAELAALAAYWPHPLIYPVRLELARAREEVSDNFVLQLTSPTQFAKTLLWAAERCQPSPRLPAAVGLVLSGWNLEQRVQGLLDPRRRSTDGLSRFNMTTYLTAAVGACMLLAGVRLSHSQTATVEVKQDGKVYVLHVNSSHPASVTVTGTARPGHFRIDGNGLHGSYVITSSGPSGKSHTYKLIKTQSDGGHHVMKAIVDGVPKKIEYDGQPERLDLVPGEIVEDHELPMSKAEGMANKIKAEIELNQVQGLSEGQQKKVQYELEYRLKQLGEKADIVRVDQTLELAQRAKEGQDEAQVTLDFSKAKRLSDDGHFKVLLSKEIAERAANAAKDHEMDAEDKARIKSMIIDKMSARTMTLRKSLALARERALAENNQKIADELQRLIDQLGSEEGH